MDENLRERLLDLRGAVHDRAGHERVAADPEVEVRQGPPLLDEGVVERAERKLAFTSACCEPRTDHDSKGNCT